MRGHEHIITLRKARCTPEWVFLNDWPCATDWAEFGDHATVCTHEDVIARLDLRFLVGLKVSCGSDTESRAKALFEAAKSFGAQLVGACHFQPGIHPHLQTGWVNVWEKPSFQPEAARG